MRGRSNPLSWVRGTGKPIMHGGPYDGQDAPVSWPWPDDLNVVDPTPEPVVRVESWEVSPWGPSPRVGRYRLMPYRDGNLEIPAYRWEGWNR
jgi:hypothetical protein